MRGYRPRLSVKELNQLYSLREQKEGVIKMLIFSDTHGVLLCKNSYSVLLDVIKNNHFDIIIINGDVCDFPYLSNHTAKLWEDSHYLHNYSEVNEIYFTRANILKPVSELAPDSDKIVRLGNHDERVTSPKRYSQSQLERLLEVHRHFNTISYAEILGLKQMGFSYDPQPFTNYYGCFDVVHGLSLAKNSSEKNIYEYMGNGSTGHTHRLNCNHITSKKGILMWLESGCMRVRDQVEYFPTGKAANWQNGFVTVTFDLREETPLFFGKAHKIEGGKTEYNGVIYDGKKIGL